MFAAVVGRDSTRAGICVPLHYPTALGGQKYSRQSLNQRKLSTTPSLPLSEIGIGVSLKAEMDFALQNKQTKVVESDFPSKCFEIAS
jgi:hypothetical protein